MVKVRLQTSSGRQQLIVSDTATPMEVLVDNQVVLEGASINLDGIVLTREELNSPIATLITGESCTLSVVVKTGNA